MIVGNEVALDSLRYCPSGWKNKNQTVELGFKMLIESAGFYLCEEPLLIFYLLPLGRLHLLYF